ncbi:hypothetical protein [Actinoplanes sp. NPDC049802]|uniref:hypothetical protein n=1 Tax=Actinoplanes sp. NPDC049802 TaxID=3154742 RepID=UPI003409D246
MVMAEPLLHLDTDALTGHANKVDSHAERLAEVAGAASHLDQQDEIYGEWPSILILPMLNIAQEDAVQELRDGADTTSNLADLVRALTVDVNLTDAEAAQVLRFQEERR